MDLAQATGQPEEITLSCGEKVSVRLLKLKEWGTLQAWFKRACPSPVTRALLALQQLAESGEDVSPSAEEKIMDHAQREALNWPPRVGSTPWFDAILKADGAVAQLLKTCLAAVDPAITDDQAEALASRTEGDDLREVLRVALHGSHPAPKAGPAEVPGLAGTAS